MEGLIPGDLIWILCLICCSLVQKCSAKTYQCGQALARLPSQERLWDESLFRLKAASSGSQGQPPSAWWGCWEDGARLLAAGHGRRVRDSGHELKWEVFKLGIRKTFLPWVKHCKRLHRVVMAPPFLDVSRSDWVIPLEAWGGLTQNLLEGEGEHLGSLPAWAVIL